MKTVIEAAGKTDVGLVRTNNEDSLGYDVNLGIFVVCDGMGGQAAGEKASRIAVNTVIDYFQQIHRRTNAKVVSQRIAEVSDRANQLADSIRLANEAIREASNRNPQWSGMGCTIVALLCHENKFSIGHVGDSRIYLIRSDSIFQLTNDHSLVMEQVRRGLMTLDEAEHSKMQNVIVRALGAEESVEPDLQDHEFVSGDVLLLCSDGLSRYIKDSDIQETLRAAESLEKACQQLIDMAKAGASDDNITCLLVRAVAQSWYKRLLG
jgi:serine/threonine protein phosphatase PrpC